MGKYTEDDFCDLYEKKICDNCGKCLEEQGVDIRAIKIEDIAKTVEENKFLEEEYKKELLKAAEEEDIEEDSDVDLLKDAYENLSKESGIDFTSLDEDYEDAFDHIEYLDESFFEEGNLEELTEEIFPGVRKLKKKSE
ncbi:hypothetical protein PM004_10730 [Clostridium paraputrificum]|uniref:hypothetical protein n=1 Tax=Clostridium TaxID=1485 RepID=UPI00232B9CDD|nr:MULTISPECIES: hypothetical protein [Clostridium]MDB2084507.1 hypothetical protein [Clostridium paraputrificum]MDB2089814.1 hypothetical protein [Clostridium paraputrificum]MDB2096011.1 hypothetical protein [Clostridium paraputrificum]MDU1179804.1 hypothetical protein [Clostridium sp.]MDU1227108.1 hypothetical protein [Clostridium sp.]